MDKAIILETDGSFAVGPGWWCAMYSHRLVALWWGAEKKLSIGASRVQLTVPQVQALAVLVDKLSKEE